MKWAPILLGVLGILGSSVLTTVAVTYWLKGELGGIQTTLVVVDLRLGRIETLLPTSWTKSDQRAFTRELEALNQRIGLRVPQEH